jgi:small nuclear ribonucleoprotein (snRNP)-like protein
MNKRTLLLLGAFLSLAVVTYFLINKDKQDAKMYFPDRDFAVKDTQNIYRIFLADRQGEQVLLERKAQGWIVNGRYEAFDHTVNMVLSTLAELSVKYIPPRESVKNLVTDIASNGIKVELYDKAGDRMKTFYVGGNVHDDRGTAFIMEGYEQPYVMHLPSLEGGLRSRFRIREHQLISRWIFMEDPDQIEEVLINYPKQRNNSFVFQNKKKGAEVKPYYPTTKALSGAILPAAAESFIYGFTKLGAEAVIMDQSERDSVMQVIPFCEILLKRKDGSEMDLQIWPIYDIVVEQESKFDNPQQEVFVERYYAYSESKGLFYLIQHHVFGKILWGYSSFFPSGTSTQKKVSG